uniref:NADH-ubiquinone oxidoreductase chain 6 n=1 Tax=Tabachnickia sp. DVL-2014 TaxID=1569960 RepID=A0A0N7AFT0_9METZ|nr:NADH dehydrogenase subunit 6 [Tabachnickia sp. DVL-2014]
MKHLLTILCINIIICSFMMITTTSTIRSTIWLILSYTNGCAILILLKLDFIALLTVIIYLGAISILFLFIIMMIDSTQIKLIKENTNTTAIGIVTSITWILLILNSNIINKHINKSYTHKSIKTESNTEIISNSLYTQLSQWFILSSIILLTAMIIAIWLIPKNIQKSLSQQLIKQIQRNILHKIKSYLYT